MDSWLCFVWINYWIFGVTFKHEKKYQRRTIISTRRILKPILAWECIRPNLLSYALQIRYPYALFVLKNNSQDCFSTHKPFGVRFSPSRRHKKTRHGVLPWRVFWWWRRGESNSCPKIHPSEALRAQFVVNIPSS